MPAGAPPRPVSRSRPRTGPDRSLQRLRDYSTVVGLLVALGVLAMAMGLIRSESAGDLRTLTATGASRATQRTLNATSAATLAVLGGILGTGAAYMALIACHWHDVGYLEPPPWLDLVALLVGLPMAATVGAWLLGSTSTTSLAARSNRPTTRNARRPGNHRPLPSDWRASASIR